VPAGITVAEVLSLAGGASGSVSAALVGGYFGSWVEASRAWELRLDAHSLRAGGNSLGCGVLWLLSATSSPVGVTARIVRYLAGESASQCGPCYFGLQALADACERIAGRRSNGGDLDRLGRWCSQVSGRGACRHPDGAVTFLRSALRVFEAEFSFAVNEGRSLGVRS
jgi:NADH:ubiquinone oxidoreductase subunit F (NADH-binding)